MTAKNSTILACLFSAIAAVGCNNWIKSSKTFSNNFLIEKESVALDRLESGQSMRLSFKTKAPASCQIKVWAQSGKAAPTKDHPTIQKCANKTPQISFVEAIGKLDVRVGYSVEISAWAAGDNSAVDHLQIDENFNGKVGNTVVRMRVDLPLHASEVYTVKTKKDLRLQDLKNHLRIENGCNNIPAAAADEWAQETDLNISELTSEGFATSTAIAHPFYVDRLQLDFNRYQNENRWRLNFNDGKQKTTLTALQGAELFNLEMQNALNYKFEDKLGLNEAKQILNFDPNKPLVLKWSADNLAELSFLKVQVGVANQTGAFSCVFDATKSLATVEPSAKLLSALTAKQTYSLLVILYSAQIQLNSSGKSPWLIESYDWRTISVQSI